MKKALLAFFPWIFILFGYKADAQENPKGKDKEKKEAEEIIIRRNNSKDAHLDIRIDGDKITINGKPLSEFTDDDVTVNKRKMIIRNGDRPRTFVFGDDFGENSGDGNMAWSNDGEKRPFLGVSTEKTDEGAKITDEVNKESAAGKAGLQKGDIITKFGNSKIDGPQSLFDAVNTKKPNDEVKITYKREGKEKTVKATLGERKNSMVKSYSFSSPDGSYKTFTMPFQFNDDQLRAEALRGLQNLDLKGNFSGEVPFDFEGAAFSRPKLGLKIQDTEEENGVKVLEVEDSSTAAIAGIKKDDIIIQVGDEKVKNTDEARDQFMENREKGTYPIKVLRGGSEMTFTIKIPKKLKTTNL